MKFIPLALIGLFLIPNVMAQTENLGFFNTNSDLLIANYDSKPDADDLMSIAAFGTMLKDERFSDVQFIATAGAYGTQGGTFIESDNLFNLAFGEHWVDAHTNKEQALSVLLHKALETLNNGGDIWIAEGGQSDISADLVQNIRKSSPEIYTKQRIHLIQHSLWNDSVTTEEKFQYVRNYTTYIKIPDGNAVGNGSPGFNTKDDSWWPKVLSNREVGKIWKEAQELANKFNVVSGYDNKTISAGGFDFSDTVEICWIFGFNDLNDTEEFFIEFLK